jgi:hypothetical protein
VPAWLRWWEPVYVITVAAALLLAVMAGWLALYRLPQLRSQLARERQARAQSEQESQQKLREAAEQLQREQQTRAALENQLAKQSAPNELLALNARPEPNVPLLILEATRASAANELALPATARNLVLWIKADARARFTSFRLQIYGADDRPVQTVTGLKRNPQGALAVSLPTQAFQSGQYLVKVYGVAPAQAELVGEYKLQIRRS